MTLGLYRNCSAEMCAFGGGELGRSTSDRAVRRKPLVRSGRMPGLWVFDSFGRRGGCESSTVLRNRAGESLPPPGRRCHWTGLVEAA
jgi:hypothetical protein